MTTVAKLSKFISVKHGFAFKGEYFQDEETVDVLVTPGNFAIGGGFQHGKYKFYAGPVPEDYVLSTGDLVLTMTDLSKEGDTLGYPALVPKSTRFRFLHNQRIGLVEFKGDGELDKEYLYYRLCASDYRNFILGGATGSTVRHTSPGRICNFEVDIPHIAVQREIASVLSMLDAKIKANEETTRRLELLTRAIFRAWFVDFEPVQSKFEGAKSFPLMTQAAFDSLPVHFLESEAGLIPEGWEIKALSEVCVLVSGGTPKRTEESYWNGEVPWYSVRDVPDEGAVWFVSTSETITEEGVLNSSAKIVPKGCTVISARGTVGKLAIAGMPTTFNQSCYGLLPKDGSSFCYLYLLMKSVVGDIQQRAHGSVFDTITRATFDGVSIVSPKEDMVTAFESMVSPFFDLILAAVVESKKLAEIRDYLLPKLIRGSVRMEATDG